MAKDHRDGKAAKMRIFFGFAEVEGGDHVIEQSVRSVAAAVVRAVQSTPPARNLRALPSATGNGGDETDQPTLFDSPTDHPQQGDAFIDDVEVLDIFETPSAEDKAGRKDAKSKKPPAYDFVPNLNLRPDGKRSLRDFFQEKRPRGQQDQLAVFVYYLSKIADITMINANYLYSCFNEVGKKVPKDILVIARNTENRKGWVDASDSKNLRITIGGENFVNHDLPGNGQSVS